MKKNKPGRKEEDVAAKLSGREPCPTCLGSGVSMDEMLNGKKTDCHRCGGRRWIRKDLDRYKDE
jgi:DnaJ-class molecular chaperone